MRILELFAGYGSQAMALERLGIPFTSEISEIDKYAIDAYNQIHGQTHNWGDICQIDENKLPYYDLITYSSPCQDFSVAGLGRGGDAGSGTRSSLLWQCERIIRAVKPKYLLMENVKNLVSEKHKHNFIKWLKVLESIGYQNFWKVLNAKDYGVPQNRERVFVVSILGGGQYLFPNPIKLDKRLKDVLEGNVDEKYYLSEKIVNRFKAKSIGNDVVGSTLGENNTRKGQRDYVYGIEHNIGALGATGNKQPKQILEPIRIKEPVICASRGRNPDNPSDRTTGNPTEQRIEINNSGCSNTLTSVQKDNYLLEPLHIKEATQKGYAEAYEGDSVTLDEPNSQTRRGRVGKQMSNTLTTSCNIGVVQVGNLKETDRYGGNPYEGRIYSAKGVSPCLSTMQGGGLEPKIINKYRIRKLTPRECWRLMGVKDADFDKLHDISNSQLYKLAGNSIVVDVLMAIFKNLFLTDEGTKGQLTLL